MKGNFTSRLLGQTSHIESQPPLFPPTPSPPLTKQNALYPCRTLLKPYSPADKSLVNISHPHTGSHNSRLFQFRKSSQKQTD